MYYESDVMEVSLEETGLYQGGIGSINILVTS